MRLQNCRFHILERNQRDPVSFGTFWYKLSMTDNKKSLHIPFGCFVHQQFHISFVVSCFIAVKNRCIYDFVWGPIQISPRYCKPQFESVGLNSILIQSCQKEIVRDRWNEFSSFHRVWHLFVCLSIFNSHIQDPW